MNVRLRKKFVWSAGLIVQEHFHINHYETDVSMITMTDDNREQNICYERMVTWIHEIANGSIMIEASDPAHTTWLKTDARVLSLPHQPVDQIIGMMLYSKLNAIAENRIMITDVNISSSMGDDMMYLHDHQESLGPFTSSGWWQDPRPTWSHEKRNNIGKVIRLDRLPEWSDYDLEWQQSDTSGSTDSVVFAKFTDENKSIQ